MSKQLLNILTQVICGWSLSALASLGLHRRGPESTGGGLNCKEAERNLRDLWVIERKWVKPLSLFLRQTEPSPGRQTLKSLTNKICYSHPQGRSKEKMASAVDTISLGPIPKMVGILVDVLSSLEILGQRNKNLLL